MADTTQLEALIRNIIEKHPQQVAEYRAGKEKLLSFFVGQIMKETRGQASPEQVHAILMKHLNSTL